jgi:hypothetical protein
MCCEMSRRHFVGLAAAGAAGATLLPASALASATQAEWAQDRWDPQRPLINPGKPLRVKPVLMYTLPKRREMTSWKSWGGVQTEQGVAQWLVTAPSTLRSLR